MCGYVWLYRYSTCSGLVSFHGRAFPCSLVAVSSVIREAWLVNMGA